MASEEPEDYSKLPLDVKLSHKVWRARVMGYEEVSKLFRKIDDEASPEYSKYTALIKKFVIDSNQIAQEKGVEATLAFVECAAAATKITSDVVSGIVTKCLSARPKTKECSIQVCLMFVEIEQQEVVLEELMKGFTNKLPKIIFGSVKVIIRIVQEFGAKVINLKVLMKAVPALFVHSDKTVRAEAKNLAIELFKWFGVAIKPTLEKNLKPVQLKELEEEWAKLPGTPPAPTRYLRSQQAQSQAVASAGGGGGGGSGDGEEGGVEAAAAPVVIDPYDLADPEDFLGKLPKDFYEKIADVKWKERKEILETVLPSAQAIKLQPGDYGEILKALKKVITKDSNVLVVALAGNMVTGFAKGLRTNFQNYASPILAGIFEKFKEKKLNVVTSLREASDTVYQTTSLANIQEEVAEALNNKNPSVKSETLLFLCRCFQQCVPSMIPKPILKTLCPLIVQKLDDTNPAVREAGMECMGTLLRVLGDRLLNTYLENIEKSKMAKIQEHREAIELKIQTGVIPSPMKGQAARPPTPSSGTQSSEPPAKPASAGPPKKKPPVLSSQKKKAAVAAESPPTEQAEEPVKKPVKTVKKTPPTDDSAPKPKKAPPSSKGGVVPAKGGGAKGKKGGKGGGAAPGIGEPPDLPEPNIANEEVDEKAAGVLPSGLLEQLADPKWKERLEACGKFKEFVEGQSPDEMQSLLYCKVLAKKPGWKDSNFQVMVGKFTVVKLLAEKAKVFGKKSMACVMSALVEKLGDIKVKATSGETLRVIAERMTLNYTSLQVMKLSFEQKSPKVHAESLEWLAQSIKDFGFLLNIKPFIDYIKKAFGATNPAVRTSAISLLGTIHLYMGAQLRIFFEDEKPALLQQIDAAFEKVAGETAPAPTRGPNVGGDEEEEEEEEEAEGGGGGKAQMSLADMMPKVDISGQIKSDLIRELGDKNWKIRGEALQKVTEILKNAKFVEPNLGDLPGALKGRLGDSNKNLIITTLNILSTLASSMGSSCVRHAKTFIPGVISTFSDSKPQVRAAAVSCLNAWHTELGMVPMVEQEFFPTALSTENPNLRSELLNWLEEKLPSAGKLPSEFSAVVPPLFSCIEDRSGEVRKKAQAALPHIMAHVGYDYMCKQSSKLNPASKQVIKTLLDKNKPSAPPPKVKQVASASTDKSGRGSPAAEDHSPRKAGTTKAKQEKAAEVKAEPPEEKEAAEKPAKTTEKKGTSGKKGVARGAARGKGGKKGGAAAEESGAVLVLVSNGKESRNKDEDKMKSLKWNFNSPRKEHVEQLKDQMQPCVNNTLFAQLFHDDFKKHIVALDTLVKSLGDASLKEAAIGTVDLLLRWVTLRFFDTNTSVNLKCLEFLKTLFQLLVSEETYRMSDYEANAFLPYLVNKVGDAKEPVRKGVRALFRDICSFYPPTKLFVFVLDGLKSKNARQRAECLEELGILIQNNGMIVCGSQPQKTVPIMAAQISDRDNTVRSAALNTMVVVYGNMGDGIYKFTSQLSDKDVSLLEERIKRSGIKPPSSVTPPPGSSSAAKPQDQQPTDKKSHGKSKLASDQTSTAESTASSSERKLVTPDQPAIEEAQLEPPPPVVPAPEPRRPGTVPGPFKLNFNYKKMMETMSTRTDKTVGLKTELSKEQAALLEEPPVDMPQLVSKYMNPSYPVNLSPTRMASTSAAINYIISQITSSDHTTSSKAIRQMEATMVNPSQRAAVNSHVDQLIRTVLMQMKMNFSTPLDTAEDKDALQQLSELGRLLTSCLVTLFSEPSLAVETSRDTLVELEHDIMNYLVDEKLLKLEEAAQLNRSFNWLVLRVCENCEKTAVFGSLIHVLLKSINTDGTPTVTTELAMKCLWKLTRQIPQLVTSINLDQLLLEIHQFMISYLKLVPSPSSEDIPYRTIKTILFHVTNTVGPELLNHLSLIKDTSGSSMTVYIRKTLAKNNRPANENEKGSKSTLVSTSTSSGSDGERRRGKTPKFTKMLNSLPPGSSSHLSEIFLKIGESSRTKEGLYELEEFHRTHPSFDLDAVLSNQTKFYREYILNGLRAIKEEREGTGPSETGCKSKTEYEEQVIVLEEMKNKLAQTFGISAEEMRSRSPSPGSSGKIQSTKSDENMPLNRPPQQAVATKVRSLRPPTSGSGGKKTGGPSSSVDLADLRRRLDKLKGTT